MADAPVDEAARVAALERLELLDRELPEARFDRIARVAARAFDVPIAYVSLIDTDTLHLIACVGLPLVDAPRAGTFCTHTVQQDDLLVVEDATADERFVDSPYVVHLGARFYAGVPVRDPVSGHRVGTVCLVDMASRTFGADDRVLLEDLGRMVEAEFTRGRLVEVAAALEGQRAATAVVADRLSTVLSSTVEAIVGLDREGTVTFANTAAAAMFGHDLEALHGADWHALVHAVDEDGRPVVAADTPEGRTLADGRHRRTSADWYLRATGAGFPAESSVSPVREGGDVVGVVVTVHDLTAQHAAERVRGDVVAAVSHELRTPLTSLQGSLGLLVHGVVGEIDDEAREVVEIARAGADRLVRLVEELLDLDRLHHGQLPVRAEPVALDQVVTTAMEVVEGMAEEAGVEVTLGGDPWVTVAADADRLVQVLVNLLGNAIRYSSPGRTVSVRVQHDDEGVTMEVTDRGRGIPPELLGAIFEPFSQVDADDPRDQRGAGLGLSIARGLVEAHGGRIDVDSQPGVGSTFRVWIPRGDVRPVAGSRAPAQGTR